MTSGDLLAGAVLAKTGEAAKSGPLGLALILVLCVACYFLFKSMSKHLKKVREEFPAPPPGREPGQAEVGAAEPDRAEVRSAEGAVAPAPADEKAPPPAS